MAFSVPLHRMLLLFRSNTDMLDTALLSMSLTTRAWLSLSPMLINRWIHNSGQLDSWARRMSKCTPIVSCIRLLHGDMLMSGRWRGNIRWGPCWHSIGRTTAGRGENLDSVRVHQRRASTRLICDDISNVWFDMDYYAWYYLDIVYKIRTYWYFLTYFQPC